MCFVSIIYMPILATAKNVKYCQINCNIVIYLECEKCIYVVIMGNYYPFCSPRLCADCGRRDIDLFINVRK